MLSDANYIEKNALISDCGCYRYHLWRQWSGDSLAKPVVFIGLNPSTENADLDDPTIRRCVGFAKSWGYDALLMVNLFALRATNPKVLKRTTDPIGPHNTAWLHRAVARAPMVVAAWGTHGSYRNRHSQVKDEFTGSLHTLKLTKNGFPSHPLYLPARLQPEPWVY